MAKKNSAKTDKKSKAPLEPQAVKERKKAPAAPVETPVEAAAVEKPVAESEPAAKAVEATAAESEPAAEVTAAEPVEEAPAPEPVCTSPRRSVALIGSECYPFVKTGGLW